MINKKKRLRMLNIFFIIINLIVFFGVFIVFFYTNSGITFMNVLRFSENSKFHNIPVDNEIDYMKGLKKDIPFSVVNSEHKKMKVLLNPDGELNYTISLNERLIDFIPSEERKDFVYSVSFDEDLSPGLHSARIVALEIPESSGEEYLGSVSRVVSELFVHVPYPGKYADGDFEIDAQKNKSSEFKVKVTNRGKLDINDLKAYIEIYSLLGEKIDSFSSNSVSLKAGEEKEVTGNWFVKVNAGDYIARVKLVYDGESREFEKIFVVGSKILSIEGLSINNFQLGEIAKLQFLVENKWNKDLNNVYANLIIYNKMNQVMADIKSSPETVLALTKKELVAYWDSFGVDEGNYNAKLTVFYNGDSVEKDLSFEVSQDNLDVSGGVGYAIRTRGGGVNLATALLILVIILLIVNLSWFVFFRRIMGKKTVSPNKAV